MSFIFLPKQSQMKPDEGCRFYIYEHFSYFSVPYSCAPVLCRYDFECGSWTNPISHQIYTTHPLGLTMKDGSFYNDLYEITRIEGLTFGEGESWCQDTNQKIHVEKTDPRSIWNPFFQRYDPPCKCGELHRINYDFENNTYHVLFNEIMNEFEKVYCAGCFRCEFCLEIHTSMYHCLEELRI